MSDTPHELTRSGLNAMAAEVGTEAGPGATTKEFNRALIETFRANRGVVSAETWEGRAVVLSKAAPTSGHHRAWPPSPGRQAPDPARASPAGAAAQRQRNGKSVGAR